MRNTPQLADTAALPCRCHLPPHEKKKLSVYQASSLNMAGPEDTSTPDPAADAASPSPANTGDTDRAGVRQECIAAGGSPQESGTASQQNNGASPSDDHDLTESDSESDTGSGWAAKQRAGDGKPAPGASAAATADEPANGDPDPVNAVDVAIAAATKVLSPVLSAVLSAAAEKGSRSEMQIPDDDAASSPAGSNVNPAPSSSTVIATPVDAAPGAPEAVDTVAPESAAGPIILCMDAAEAGATDAATAAGEPEPAKRKPQIGLQRVRKKASPAEQAAFQASLEDKDKLPQSQSSSSPSEIAVTVTTEPTVPDSSQSPQVTAKVTPRPRSKEYLRTIKMEKEEAAAAAAESLESNNAASTKSREKYLADRALKSSEALWILGGLSGGGMGVPSDVPRADVGIGRGLTTLLVKPEPLISVPYIGATLEHGGHSFPPPFFNFSCRLRPV